jgi:hypothetical protein
MEGTSIGVNYPNIKCGENEILMECRSGMTSITLAVSKLDVDCDELIDQCVKLEDKYNKIQKFVKENNKLCWDLLGYCNIMFITDWLEPTHSEVSRKYETPNDPQDNMSYQRKAYICGVNNIYNYLFEVKRS